MLLLLEYLSEAEGLEPYALDAPSVSKAVTHTRVHPPPDASIVVQNATTVCGPAACTVTSDYRLYIVLIAMALLWYENLHRVDY